MLDSLTLNGIRIYTEYVDSGRVKLMSSILGTQFFVVLFKCRCMIGTLIKILLMDRMKMKNLKPYSN